jgi:hydrogenase expression/formation protein HypC
MCLSVPGRVTEVFDDDGLRMGKVAFGGVAKSVCLEHVPEAGVGDYVLVHVGFALARIDEDEARRIFEFLATVEPLEEEVAP